MPRPYDRASLSDFPVLNASSGGLSPSFSQTIPDMVQRGVFRGVVFDMDGVLCDSEPFLYRAAREMFRQRFGVEVGREDFAPFVGTGEDRYLGGVAEKHGVVLRMPEDKNRTYEIYLGLIDGELEALPGVLQFVRACRGAGLKTAVATSADQVKMEGNLRQIGLPPEAFDVLVTGSDVRRKKPDPEVFLTAIRRMGLSPENCLVLEDSPSGVEAAARAGARCLGILSTFSQADLSAKGATWTVASLSETPADLLQLLGMKDAQPLATIEARLRRHVAYLAGQLGERNSLKYDRLSQAYRFIGDELTEAGYPIDDEVFQVGGAEYRNLVVEKRSAGDSNRVFVVGAHYDTAPGTPGADDNASAVAVLLELARLLQSEEVPLTVRLVAFTLEEPPFFRTRNMGSRVHARRARLRGDEIAGMISLEMVGYYSDRPGSQSFPLPFMNRFYPDHGDFVAVAGNFRSRRLVRQLAGLLARQDQLPVETVVLPLLPYAGLSDNWSFWKEGFSAVMLTDTAFFRNPNYHRAGDLPETLDYPRMARLVRGLVGLLTSCELG